MITCRHLLFKKEKKKSFYFLFLRDVFTTILTMTFMTMRGFYYHDMAYNSKQNTKEIFHSLYNKLLRSVLVVGYLWNCFVFCRVLKEFKLNVLEDSFVKNGELFFWIFMEFLEGILRGLSKESKSDSALHLKKYNWKSLQFHLILKKWNANPFSIQKNKITDAKNFNKTPQLILSKFSQRVIWKLFNLLGQKRKEQENIFCSTIFWLLSI